MKNVVRQLAAKVGWRLPLSRVLSGRRPAILTYHGIPRHGQAGEVDAATFERQMVFLKAHFDLVSWEQLATARTGLSPVQVLLTFDDGFRNNAEVVAPILRRHRIPAVFFVCSRHAEPHKYLWFSYLRALEQWYPGNALSFRGQLFDMSPSRRASSAAQLRSALLNLRPHPGAMYKAIEMECPRLEDFAPASGLADRSAGMTDQQVKELSSDPLFTIGIHTVDHPYLTKCEPAEMTRQIEDNKRWVQQLTSRNCDLIAYPLGDHCGQVLKICQRLHLRYGFTVEKSIEGDAELQLFRVGIYRPSLDELGVKVRWGRLITRLQSHGYLASN
jgi:peptidoglycan/xylan/chitin deacetylase (PgdA/CDA1 family)